MAKLLEQRRSLHRRIAQQAQTNEQLKSEMGQMQPLANLGMASAMIAHEMNNILTPLGTYAELALQHLDDPALTEKALRKSMLGAARAARILESMLALAGGQTQPRQQHQVRSLVQEIFDCLARDFSKDGIDVRIEIEDDVTVWAEGVGLQQAMMNLILNAREAMLGRGGTLTIHARQDDSGAEITISDTGRGMDAGQRDRIFEAFYTTKDGQADCGRTGTGLGLALCKRVIDEHGGSIRVESEPGQGSTFRLRLPRFDMPLG